MRMTEPSWVGDLLACPRCSSPVRSREERWRCEACGPVGGTTLGFPDFLEATSALPMAAAGRFDLTRDRQIAGELSQATSRDYAGLCELTARLRLAADRSRDRPAVRRAQDRSHRRMARLSADGMIEGGAALLSKLDTKLGELGWPPVPGGLALEAGGGTGLFLPAFCDRFERVVFVDASMVNLVLAAKLVEEMGLQNVAFVRADVMALPFGTSLFDLVHQNGVIEHVSDPERMVREATRVRTHRGYYVCVSPNRHSLLREPHFGIPAFGFIPPPVRRALIPRARGLSLEEAATDPRSLRRLRRCLATPDDEVSIFFLPRELALTARRTAARAVVVQMLARPRLGEVVHVLLNRALLPVVPHHIVIARPRAAARPMTPAA